MMDNYISWTMGGGWGGGESCQTGSILSYKGHRYFSRIDCRGGKGPRGVDEGVYFICYNVCLLFITIDQNYCYFKINVE